MLRSTCAALLLVTASGCWSQGRLFERSSMLGTGTGDHDRNVALPVPTSSQVLLVNGTPLTLSGYHALRSQFPDMSRDQLLWVAESSLALRDESIALGRELTLPQSVDLARYALGLQNPIPAETALRIFEGSSKSLPTPEDFRKKLTKLVSQAVVQRNPQVLAELH